MLLTLCTLLLAAPAPDIMTPGHKAVTHTITLEGELHGHRLVAAPTAGFGLQEVQLGVAFEFSDKYGTRLWALRPEDVLPERWMDGGFDGLALSADLPNEVHSVSIMSPLARVSTTLRVEGLERGELELEFVGEQRFDEAGRSMKSARWRRTAYISVFVGSALALLLLRRWRRRAQRAAA